MFETLVGRVPDEWCTTTLGELCASGGGDIQTGPFGSQLHASDYVPVGIPSVMPQNIGDNVLLEDGIARITQDDANRLSRYLLKPGDIVYSRRGDVERRAWIRAEQSGWLCGTGCLRARVGKSADSRFVSYYLGHPNVRAWIVQHAIGATMPNLNTGILGSVPVVMPTKYVQVAIAELLSSLDDKIAINGRIAETSRKLSISVGQRLFTDAAGETVTLGNCADIVKGLSYRSSDLGSGTYGLVSLKCVGRDGDFRPIGIKPYHGEYKATQAVGDGDIVVAQTDLTQRAEVIGRPVRVLNHGGFTKLIASLDLVIVRPYPPLSREALLALLSTEEFREHALSYCNGTTVVHLSSKALPEFKFNMPQPDAMQSTTVKMTPLLGRADQAKRENQNLIELRDTLLPKLMSGEIRVRDAEKVVEDVT